MQWLLRRGPSFWPLERRKFAGEHSFINVLGEEQACVMAMRHISQPVAVPSVSDGLQKGEVGNGQTGSVVRLGVWCPGRRRCQCVGEGVKSDGGE